MTQTIVLSISRVAPIDTAQTYQAPSTGHPRAMISNI
ncbi:uncharacterized protein J3R85_003009 [Psidium guajava]|nr:uncharacterized protein J3R85_003009 [Psidium guajava]